MKKLLFFSLLFLLVWAWDNSPRVREERALRICRNFQDNLRKEINDNADITTAMIKDLGSLDGDEEQFNRMMDKIDSLYGEKEILDRQQNMLKRIIEEIE